MADDSMHRFVDEVLLEWAAQDQGPMRMGALSVEWVLIEVEKRATKASKPFQWRQAIEYWWHLARLGVIATTGQAMHGIAGQPHTFVTGRGSEYLKRGACSPHDPPRFLAAVRARVTPPDELVLAYVDEAVGAWTAQLYRASVVMIGCACEHLVLELARALADCSLIGGKATKIGQKLVARAGISGLFDDVKVALEDLDDKKKLKAVGDAWDRDLASVFDRARRLRNSAGHPTGTPVDANDAEAGLLLFPDFYERLNQLTQHVRSLG